MRTSVDIDDQLLLQAKHQAIEEGCTLKQILENALRDFFARQSKPRQPIHLHTVGGTGLKPGINLDDSRSMNDILDGR